MQSRQTLFFLIVAAAALFQSSFGAPTTAPSEVSQDSQALSQAPGAKFVAIGATGKEQSGKAVDLQSAVQQAPDATAKDQTGKASETQSSLQQSQDATVKDQAGKDAETQTSAQQLQGAAADNSAKSQPAEQVRSPQQLVDAENRPEQSAHQKRTESSDEPTVILKVKPDAHPDVAHEQGDAGAKDSSAEESSSKTDKPDKLAVAKTTFKPPSQQEGLASSKGSAANESKDEHAPASTGDSQENDEHKDAHRMKARSEDTKEKESKDQDTPSSSNQEGKILADHSTHASPSEDTQNADNKSTAHAVEDKQDPHPKEDAKVLVDGPAHAADSEEKKDADDKRIPMDSSTQKQALHENQGQAFEHH